ncbi:MAG TPA: hypothetical protein VNK52_00415 [Hyphomicrobiaceae bacterium]|nr:hypothetical protein [Hyphomicrobiaceae bacterium]
MEGKRRDSGLEERPEPVGADFILPVLACALTAYYLITTRELVWEARVTATFIGVILFSLSAIQFTRLFARLVSGRANPSLGELVANTLHNRQRLGLVSLVALFIGTIEWVGTTLGLVLLLIGCMLILGVRRITTLLAISVTTAAAVYVLLIYLLESRLPKGPVEALIAHVLGLGG